MRTRRGVDQLDIDLNLFPRPADTTFHNILDTEFSPDLLYIRYLPFVAEGSRASDDRASRDAREIGGQVVGDPIGKVLLLWIIADVGEGQHDDRHSRCTRRDPGLC